MDNNVPQNQKNEMSKIIDMLIGKLHDYKELINRIKEAKIFTELGCESFDEFTESNPDYLRFKDTAFKLMETMRFLEGVIAICEEKTGAV